MAFILICYRSKSRMETKLIYHSHNYMCNCINYSVDARSCNHRCSGKAISITYSVCVCVCVCGHGYPACNAHAPYCHLRPAPLFNIFPPYPVKGTIFEREKKLLNTKCVFWYSVQLMSETLLILGTSEWNMIKTCLFVFQQITRYPCKILIKFDFFSKQFLGKCSYITFMIRPMEAESFHADGRTDMKKLIFAP